MAEVPLPGSQQPELDPSAMELDNETPLDFGDKIEILKGYEPDLSSATYCLHHEDHTIGNALRYMLMKNKNVDFCGYSAPHPSEPKIHLRIQMCGRRSSLEALREALENLESLFQTIGNSYQEDLDKGDYERFQDAGYTEEEMREVIRKGEEIKAEKKRQEGRSRTPKAESAT